MSHSFGPFDLGDNTKGMLNRVWRVRTDGLNIWLARSNDTFDGYGEEQHLVLLAGDPEPPIREIDLAFDQNGRVVICSERLTGPLATPEVWLYWFDPVWGMYTYDPVAFGRNPRVILDEPVPQSQTSDVLLWYFANTEQVLTYRLQRDRYNTEYFINAIPAQDSFVEDAYRSIDNRVHVLFSVRDLVKGTYTLDHVESTLYPFWPTAEEMVAGLILLEGSGLFAGLLETQILEVFAAALALTGGGGSLFEALIQYDQSSAGRDLPESFEAALPVFSGTLITALIIYSALDQPESMSAATALTSGVLVVGLFHFVLPADSMTGAATVTGGSLGVP